MGFLNNLAAFAAILLTNVKAADYGYNHVGVQKDSAIVGANFPDVPGVKLFSPAFTLNSTLPGFSNGTQGPTSLETLDAFIQSIVDRNDWATYYRPNFTSEDGRILPFVILSQPGGTSEKVRIWIQGGHHGNEPSGDETTLALLGALDANQTWAASLLEKVDITILPRYNADGVFYFQRELASNNDPNRDHSNVNLEQTIGIRKLLNDFKPHVSVDLHEYTGSTRYLGRYQPAADALIAAGKHPLIHQSIRDLSEELFAANIGRDLEALDLRWEPYVTNQGTLNGQIVLKEANAEARIGRNSWALQQSVAFLLETRGIRLADQHFQRRTVTSLTALTSILQTAADHAEEVKSTIAEAAEEFVESTEDIILTYDNELIDRDFTLIDSANGSVVQVPIQFRPTVNLQPRSTRSRPDAYIIPRPWALVAEKLRFLGVEVETLTESWSGIVESLEVISLPFQNGAVVEGEVRTETTLRERMVPAGSFWVSTKQRNAALAFVVLEPETVDSFVTQRIISVSEGDEYPIFRVLK